MIKQIHMQQVHLRQQLLQAQVILHIQAPAGVDITANNEGFAIADASYTVDGQRPVYRFKDGEKSSAVESPKTGGNNAVMFWGEIGRAHV